MTDLREAVRLGAREAPIFEHLGYLHNRTKDYDKSIEMLDEALAVDPKYVGALYERGVAHEGKGDHERAIRDLSAAIELSPKYANAYH